MLKLKNIGGERVERGNYWNFTTGQRVHMEERGVLPGGTEDAYFRVPPVVVLLAAPVLGLVYAAFLPFIGIAMLLGVAGKKVFGGVADTVWKGAGFSWKPTEAYLSGKKGKARKSMDKSEDEKKE